MPNKKKCPVCDKEVDIFPAWGLNTGIFIYAYHPLPALCRGSGRIILPEDLKDAD